jgi:polyisoprenoid-binding protein YceI
MKNIIITLALITASLCASAQTVNNITKATIRFEIKNLGIKTGGTVAGIKGNITFDPDKLATSHMEVTADANTIDTDNSMRDEHLKGEDYFDVEKYPKIGMSSVSIKKKSGNSFAGMFNITIKGKTKLIEVPFTYATVGPDNTFKGSFKINRRDFAIGGSSMTMGDEVTVLFEAETSNSSSF